MSLSVSTLVYKIRYRHCPQLYHPIVDESPLLLGVIPATQ